MSPKISVLRTPLVVLGGIALSLTLARCSPLSLSQSKLRPAQSPGAPALNTPGTVRPIGGTALGPGEQASALTGTQATVQEFSEYQIEISTLPAEQRLTVTPDEGEALEGFRSTRTIIIHFAGHAPDHCKAYLGLTMSDTMIANYGWNNAFNPIATDCSPLPDGNWKVSVSPSVTLDTWTLLSPTLVGLTIFAGNNPQMTIVDPAQHPGAHPPVGGVHITPGT